MKVEVKLKVNGTWQVYLKQLIERNVKKKMRSKLLILFSNIINHLRFLPNISSTITSHDVFRISCFSVDVFNLSHHGDLVKMQAIAHRRRFQSFSVHTYSMYGMYYIRCIM